MYGTGIAASVSKTLFLNIIEAEITPSAHRNKENNLIIYKYDFKET